MESNPATSSASPVLSVVVPFFREGPNICAVVAELTTHADRIGVPYELVLIDDGSPDDTWEQLRAEAARVPSIRAFRLSRNFGKEAAVCLGVEQARGRAVVVMDGDLQHPPALLPQMVELWREGKGQIIEAVKRDRGEETWLSKLFANLFYALLQRLSNIDLRGASDFKLMDRQVVSAYLEMRERHVFFRGMIAWLGFKRERITFDVPQRIGGASKWSYAKRFRLAMTAISAFSSVLLQFVTICGGLFFVFAFFLGAWTIWQKFSGNAVTGFATVILLQLVIGSLLMISLGILGEYLARIYDEVKARPRYVVSETAGHGGEMPQPSSVTAAR